LSTARSVRNWLSLLVFVGTVAVMDYALISYLISHGLEARSYPIQIGSYQFSFPLLSLTFLGMLIVAIAAWRHTLGMIPISALKEMSQLEAIRILRAAALALFFFTAALFVPYIVGASAFWAQMSALTRVIPQLASPLQGLISLARPFMNADDLTKLAVSQNVAAAALVGATGLIGYLQRRIRRIR
jgi:hypothetical protein